MTNSSLIEKISALKEVVYYVDGQPNMSPYADQTNAKLDAAIAIIRQHQQASGDVVRLLEKAKYFTGFDLKSTSESMLIQAHDAINAAIEAINMGEAQVVATPTTDSAEAHGAEGAPTPSPAKLDSCEISVMNTLRERLSAKAYCPVYHDLNGKMHELSPVINLDTALNIIEATTTKPVLVSLNDIYGRGAFFTRFGPMSSREHAITRAVLDEAGVKYVD